MSNRRTWVTKTAILLLMLALSAYGAYEFYLSRTIYDHFVPSEYLTEVRYLGDYDSSLKGTYMDAPLYFFDSGNPGSTVFVMGGVHANESAGILSCHILMENLVVERGRVIVLPAANLSALSGTSSGNGYPYYYEIETGWGHKRYSVGSRTANPLDQWPDPPMYVHYPSRQALCYDDSRNLNRNFPGNEKGQLVERVGNAIMTLLKQEQVSCAFDLHEASITYPVNNTYVVPDKAFDIAYLASLLLLEEGLDMRLESSAESLKGYSHRQWGELPEVYPFLIESPTPFIDRVSGILDQDLIRYGKDEFLQRLYRRGMTAVEYEEGYDLEYRCGLHLSGMLRVLEVAPMLIPGFEIDVAWPGYEQLRENGVGYFIKDPSKAETVQYIRSRGK